jgi:hypothetical protein
MVGCFCQLDNDSAETKQAMHFGKPQFALPVQADTLTLFLQLRSLKSSTLPKATGHGSEDGILCALQKNPPARTNNSRNLPQAWLGIRQILEHPSARRTIKGVIFERKFGQGGSHVVDSVVGESFSGPIEHFRRQVGRHNSRVIIRMPDEMSQKLSGSRSDVEDVLASLDRECASLEEARSQRFVKADDAART